ncbi:MAG: hypothetical protein KBC32_00960 [Candidatus Didemnitutus sp.]|nr:hypothetical protein [Candidatus Didemnitutus sp.]
MKKTLGLICLLAALLSGCGDSTLPLPKEEVERYVPDTVRRVDRLRDVPTEVCGAIAADLGLSLQDRRANWTGGCSAGVRLLEAGERKDGWWVFYELGGIVDTKRLALVQHRGGKLTVVSTTILQ